jgi:hypothetical protein
MRPETELEIRRIMVSVPVTEEIQDRIIKDIKGAEQRLKQEMQGVLFNEFVESRRNIKCFDPAEWGEDGPEYPALVTTIVFTMEDTSSGRRRWETSFQVTANRGYVPSQRFSG